MSSPAPDPGAVPDSPSFTELPSDEPAAPGEPVPPAHAPEDAPEDDPSDG